MCVTTDKAMKLSQVTNLQSERQFICIHYYIIAFFKVFSTKKKQTEWIRKKQTSVLIWDMTEEARLFLLLSGQIKHDFQ